MTITHTTDSYVSGSNGLEGVWDVTYEDGGTSTLKIEGNTVNILSCDWNVCDTIMESSIVQTDDENNFPHKDGWKKIPQIHRLDVYLYIRLMSTGKITVKYKDDGDGTGVKQGIL